MCDMSATLCVFETQVDLTFSYPYSHFSHTVTLTAASPLILSRSRLSLLHSGRKNGEHDKNYDTLDLPKRTEPTKGTSSIDTPELLHL